VIVEVGHAALWLAAALALFQALAPDMGQQARARGAAIAQGGLTMLAFAALGWAFWVSDFSVALVAAHSHTDKPALYKLTGLWANHEGSMLLWVMVLSLAGMAVALSHSRLGERFQARVLQAQGAVALGFYGFMLAVSNPFERLLPAPPQGQGLNPILQDPGLAFHPPLLYVGYVGLSVAFAFAVAGMVENRIGPQWARAVRPWVLGAWSALTAGIILGSFWAYYELGWGGFWFWDPVENASLMPWLAATALLHCVAVLAKRDALRAWTVLLAVAAFALSMVGTFLVRSGVLTSVHSFAVDPERGLVLLVLLGVYVGGALGLYAWRAGRVPVGEGFALVSREGGLVANNLLLAAILGVVIVGTLWPLLVDAMGWQPISIGPPYFVATVGPLSVPLAILLGAGPLIMWKRMALARLWPRLAVPAMVAALCALATLAFAEKPTVWAILGFALAGWIAGATLVAFARARSTMVPGALAGMVLAHLGVAVALAGVTGAVTQIRDELHVIPEGGSVQFGRWRAGLVGVEPVAGPNYTAIRARILVRDGERDVALLSPETRTYPDPPMETTEAGFASLLGGDLYATLGKPTVEGGWQVRLAWKPLITWVWAGGLMIALGGLVSALARSRARAGKPFVEPAARPDRPAGAPLPAPPLPAE
jgi:cytochrome c-type biogenesis protein CcmF